MILLVNPMQVFDGTAKERFGTPLSLGYLSSYLRKYGGLSSEIVECIWADFPYYFKRFKPRIVGISAMLWQMRSLGKMVSYIKKVSPLTKIVVGGYLPTFQAIEVFSSLGRNVDFAVIGEGEQTFLELCQRILKNGSHFDEIPGLAFMSGREVIFTPPRRLIDNLDILPFPKRRIRFGFATVMISRGCPYNCAFCSIRNFYGNKFRTRSVGNIISELELLREKGIGYVKFLNDNSIISYKFFEEFHRQYISRKLNQMKSSIMLSSEIILNNPEILAKMREMNIHWVGIGIETLDEKARKLFRIEGKISDPLRLIELIRNSPYDGEFKFFQILNTGFEKSIDEVKRNSLLLFKAIRGIKNVRLEPGLLQPWPGTDIKSMLIEKGLSVSDILAVTTNESHISSSYVSRKELSDWFSAYCKMLIKAGYLLSPPSLSERALRFSLSSVRFSTKLRMMGHMLSHSGNIFNAASLSESLKDFF